MSPGGIPAEVDADGVRIVLSCRNAPRCQTKLDVDLEYASPAMVTAFLESRVAVHLRCIAIELGWGEDDACPTCRATHVANSV